MPDSDLPLNYDRLLGAPFDALLPWERDQAVLMAHRHGRQLTLDEEIAFVTGDHPISEPPHGPAAVHQYVRSLIEPAMQRGRLAPAHATFWRRVLQWPQAHRDDPRVQAWTSAKWEATVARCAHIDRERLRLARHCATRFDTVTPSCFFPDVTLYGYHTDDGHPAWLTFSSLRAMATTAHAAVLRDSLLGLRARSRMRSALRLTPKEFAGLEAYARQHPNRARHAIRQLFAVYQRDTRAVAQAVVEECPADLAWFVTNGFARTAFWDTTDAGAFVRITEIDLRSHDAEGLTLHEDDEAPDEDDEAWRG